MGTQSASCRCPLANVNWGHMLRSGPSSLQWMLPELPLCARCWGQAVTRQDSGLVLTLQWQRLEQWSDFLESSKCPEREVDNELYRAEGGGGIWGDHVHDSGKSWEKWYLFGHIHISRSPDTFRPHRCCGVCLVNIRNRLLSGDHAIWLQH